MMAEKRPLPTVDPSDQELRLCVVVVVEGAKTTIGGGGLVGIWWRPWSLAISTLGPAKSSKKRRRPNRPKKRGDHKKRNSKTGRQRSQNRKRGHQNESPKPNPEQKICSSSTSKKISLPITSHKIPYIPLYAIAFPIAILSPFACQCSHHGYLDSDGQ